MTSPKVRAFVDFLVERLNFDADYMQVKCPDRKRLLAAQEASRVAKAELSKARRNADALPTAVTEATFEDDANAVFAGR